jgi:hypothetical protein
MSFVPSGTKQADTGLAVAGSAPTIQKERSYFFGHQNFLALIFLIAASYKER